MRELFSSAAVASAVRCARAGILQEETTKGSLVDVSFNGFTAHSFKNRNGGYQYSRNIEAQEDAKNEGFSEEALARIPEKDRRWSWVEVSRSAIQYNVSETRRLLGQRSASWRW